MHEMSHFSARRMDAAALGEGSAIDGITFSLVAFSVPHLKYLLLVV
jgi:hypothetical protein